MKDAIDTWADEIVRKIVEAERLSGGFRLYHEHAAREIAERVRQETKEAREALDDLRQTLTRMAARAEEIHLGESPSLMPYRSRMIHAQDLQDVLDGKTRY